MSPRKLPGQISIVLRHYPAEGAGDVLLTFAGTERVIGSYTDDPGQPGAYYVEAPALDLEKVVEGVASPDHLLGEIFALVPEYDAGIVLATIGPEELPQPEPEVE
jgi:hypothetical protein